MTEFGWSYCRSEKKLPILPFRLWLCWRFGPLPAGGRAQFSEPAAPGLERILNSPVSGHPARRIEQLAQGGGARPLVLQVGSHVMFGQAHIPGAQFAGPGSQPAGLQLLESKVASAKERLHRDLLRLLPLESLPERRPRFHGSQNLGFTNVKVLYLAQQFWRRLGQQGFER